MPFLRQWKATVILLGTILCLAGVFLFWGIKARHHDFETKIVDEQQHVHALFDLTTKQIFAHYRFRLQNIVATRPQLVAALAKGDRAALLAQCLPLFEILQRESPTIAGFHFYTPDNRSFLRVHQPEQYGDDLSSRPMVAEINKKHKPLAGYETGREGFFYRVIQPVFVGESYVGAVAFSFTAERLVELIAGEVPFCRKKSRPAADSRALVYL